MGTPVAPNTNPVAAWAQLNLKSHSTRPAPLVVCKMLSLLLLAVPAMALREAKHVEARLQGLVPPESIAIGSQALTWPAEDEPWPKGRLGIQMELAYGRWMMLPMRKAYEATALEAVKSGIVSKVGEAGLKVAVEATPMMWAEERSAYILPLFVSVEGISDYDAFSRENLEGVKATLLKTSLEGQPGPGGGYATDGEPMEVAIKNSMGDALKSSSIKNVSRLQLQLDVEFWRESFAAKAEVSDESELPKWMWEKVTGEFWKKAYQGGVDVFIASPEYTKEHLSPRVFGFSEARAYSDGGWEKCVFAPDFDVADSDDGEATFYYSDDKKVLGMRSVVTFFSLNGNFEKNLPDIRNQMMLQLMKDLPGPMQATPEQSSCSPCGWSPTDPRLHPVPHDSVTCGPLPTS